MKYILVFLSIFLFTLGCKETISSCENGRYDEGEIGVDCGGICVDCIFDKDDIMNKNWTDLDSLSRIQEHLFVNNNEFYCNWTSPGIFSFSNLNWDWVNDSDTLVFSYYNFITNDFDFIQRKILYINDGSYKFTTDLDNWEKVHPAILFE